MSEETTVETVTAETDQVTDEPQGKPDVDWKGEARKWENRAKADYEAANKWREFELSQKSEYDKLTEKVSEYEAQAAQAQTKLLKYEVATAKGIPNEALDLLTGSSREELESAADKLLSLIADQSKPNAPKPDLNQGKPAIAGSTPADQFAAALANLI
jgi:hypothetical protein